MINLYLITFEKLKKKYFQKKIFCSTTYVVLSLFSSFRCHLSIHLWSIHTYKSSYSNNRVFRVALVIVLVAGWCSLCAYKKWGRLCVLPLNGHIFLLCYLRWMEEKSGHSFIIEVWSSQSGSFVSCYLMALVGWSKKSRGNHFQSRFMRTSF